MENNNLNHRTPPSFGNNLDKMPEVSQSVSDERDQISERDVCGVCGVVIKTQIFRGEGACSDAHYKDLYGTAKRPTIHPTEVE